MGLRVGAKGRSRVGVGARVGVRVRGRGRVYLYEEVLEPYERVLVHGVDLGEVRDREEEKGAALGHGDVPGEG